MKNPRVFLVIAIFALAIVAPGSLYAERGSPQQSRTIRMFGGGYRLHDSGENAFTGTWSVRRFLADTPWFVGGGSTAGLNRGSESSLVETAVMTGWRFSAPAFPVAATIGARIIAVASPHSDSSFLLGGGPSLVIEAPAHTPFGIAISIDPSVVSDLGFQPRWSMGVSVLGVIRSRMERRVLPWEPSAHGDSSDRP